MASSDLAQHDTKSVTETRSSMCAEHDQNASI